MSSLDSCAQPVRSQSSVSTKVWTSESLRQLRELAQAGVPVETIAARLRRTPSAVRNKAGMHFISLKRA